MANSALIATIIIPPFGFVDFQHLRGRAEDVFYWCLVVRALMALPCGLYFWQVYSRKQRNELIPGSTTVTSLVDAGLILQQWVVLLHGILCMLTGGGESSYFVGLSMIFSGIAIMVPFHPRFQAVIGVSGLTYFIVLSFLFDRFTPTTLTNLSFLCATAVIAWYGRDRVYKKAPVDSISAGCDDDGKGHFKWLLKRMLTLKKIVAGSLVSALVPLLGGLPWKDTPLGRAAILQSKPLVIDVVRLGRATEHLTVYNSSFYPVDLNGAQLLISESIEFTVYRTTNAMQALLPGETADIYSVGESGDYSLRMASPSLPITNIIGSKLSRYDIQVFGWRYVLPKTNAPKAIHH
jgi:hypothetical protein